MNVKTVLDGMNYSLNGLLARSPYAAAFLLSYTKDEFCDGKVPDLERLRLCVRNVSDLQLSEIRAELYHF